MNRKREKVILQRKGRRKEEGTYHADEEMTRKREVEWKAYQGEERRRKEGSTVGRQREGQGEGREKWEDRRRHSREKEVGEGEGGGAGS